MKRGQPLKRSKGLRRVSKKRQAEHPDPHARFVAAVFNRDEGRCRLSEAQCWGPLAVHHVRPVGQGGDRYDPANGVLLCAGHHNFVHDHPAWARNAGWLQ